MFKWSTTTLGLLFFILHLFVCVCVQVNDVQLYGKSRREVVSFLKEVPPPFTLVCCRHPTFALEQEPESESEAEPEPAPLLGLSIEKRSQPTVEEVGMSWNTHTHTVPAKHTPKRLYAVCADGAEAVIGAQQRESPGTSAGSETGNLSHCTDMTHCSTKMVAMSYLPKQSQNILIFAQPSCFSDDM